MPAALDPPDPETAETPAAFRARLAEVKLWAGNPSFDQLARRSGVPRSTLADAVSARRTRLPALDVVRRFVGACGVDADGRRRWETVWLRLRRAELPHPADPAVDACPPAEADASDGPAPTTVSAGETVTGPSLLPADLADFVGRDKVLARLVELLTPTGERPAPVVVSAVSGRGGVGKTTLAVRVAHRLAEHFPDGQLYVDLRGVDAEPADPAAVLARFLRWLGVDGTAVPADLEDRAALYRARLAGRRVLVVLDNARSAAQVTPLLPGSGTCAVLITSRSRLADLPGVRRVDLDVLEPAEAVELLAAVAGREAVASQPEAAFRIAELCGFLPLAVRIAGARLAARPHRRLDWLATRLADDRRRLSELSLSDLDLRSSLALSYRALPPAAARALRMLALVEAPDVAAWVAMPLVEVDRDEAEELVDTLAEAYLLDPVGTDATGCFRYRMHDLVRLYAREMSAAEDAEEERRAALGRLAGAWLTVAEHANTRGGGWELPPIRNPAPRHPLPAGLLDELTAEPMDWFDAERAGVVALVEACRREGFSVHAWGLAAACGGYFDARGYYDDGLRLFTLALDCCRRAGDGLGEAVALLGTGLLWSNRPAIGEPDQLAVTGRAAELFAAHGEPLGHASAVGLLGYLHQKFGRPDEAIRCADEVEEILGRSGVEHPHLAVSNTLTRGFALNAQGRYDEAEAAYLRARQVAARLGVRGLEAMALRAVGSLYGRRGRLDDASRCLRQALEILRDVDHAAARTATLLALGVVLTDLGDPKARTTLEEALAACRRLGVDYGQAMALNALGDLHRRHGRVDAAVACCTEALRIAEGLGEPLLRASIHRSLGDAHHGGGDRAAAVAAWSAARDLYAELANQAEVEALEARVAAATSGTED